MDEKTFQHLLKIARLSERPEDYLPHLEEIVKLMKRVEEITFSEYEEETTFNPLRKDVEIPFGEDITTVFPRKKDRYLEVPKNL